MILFEKPTVEMIIKAMSSLLFVGIFSGACGYTLQNVGQQYVRPSIASLLMSLESVFSAIFAWIILGEMLGSREMLGAILMFSAIILAQLPIKGR
jgi:transporter